ncbi:recombination protein O N-terminal domain-containing protein [Candidatus Uhrbacteria bacterium]|nr:recombination protein O N-terminal domain-containing protein [Candidatus Uhrbacteria bacterium]
MPYLRDRVFILKNEPFREHDARVVMYGREHGKLSAVARGVRRMSAKQLGHLEPLTNADVMIAVGQSFDKLAVAQTVMPRTGLREDLGAMAVLGPLAHLVESLTRPGVADLSIYELLEETADLWQSTDRLPSPERGRLILAAASLRLLDALGEAPDFDLIDHKDLPEGAMTLLRFMRLRPLRDLLAVTAPSTLFVATSAMVETALERTPLATNLHGPATIYALLA